MIILLVVFISLMIMSITAFIYMIAEGDSDSPVVFSFIGIVFLGFAVYGCFKKVIEDRNDTYVATVITKNDTFVIRKGKLTSKSNKFVVDDNEWKDAYIKLITAIGSDSTIYSKIDSTILK